ncbi:unnamed protein product [Pedinophyceae sp. YPF-701]|nr:unnamed protein product [Pedinophyceae sp. YPF-701]
MEKRKGPPPAGASQRGGPVVSPTRGRPGPPAGPSRGPPRQRSGPAAAPSVAPRRVALPSSVADSASAASPQRARFAPEPSPARAAGSVDPSPRRSATLRGLARLPTMHEQVGEVSRPLPPHMAGARAAAPAGEEALPDHGGFRAPTEEQYAQAQQVIQAWESTRAMGVHEALLAAQEERLAAAAALFRTSVAFAQSEEERTGQARDKVSALVVQKEHDMHAIRRDVSELARRAAAARVDVDNAVEDGVDAGELRKVAERLEKQLQYQQQQERGGQRSLEETQKELQALEESAEQYAKQLRSGLEKYAAQLKADAKQAANIAAAVREALSAPLELPEEVYKKYGPDGEVLSDPVPRSEDGPLERERARVLERRERIDARVRRVEDGYRRLIADVESAGLKVQTPAVRAAKYDFVDTRVSAVSDALAGRVQRLVDRVQTLEAELWRKDKLIAEYRMEVRDRELRLDRLGARAPPAPVASSRSRARVDAEEITAVVAGSEKARASSATGTHVATRGGGSPTTLPAEAFRSGGAEVLDVDAERASGRSGADAPVARLPSGRAVAARAEAGVRGSFWDGMFDLMSRPVDRVGDGVAADGRRMSPDEASIRTATPTPDAAARGRWGRGRYKHWSEQQLVLRVEELEVEAAALRAAARDADADRAEAVRRLGLSDAAAAAAEMAAKDRRVAELQEQVDILSDYDRTRAALAAQAAKLLARNKELEAGAGEEERRREMREFMTGRQLELERRCARESARAMLAEEQVHSLQHYAEVAQAHLQAEIARLRAALRQHRPDLVLPPGGEPDLAASIMATRGVPGAGALVGGAHDAEAAGAARLGDGVLTTVLEDGSGPEQKAGKRSGGPAAPESSAGKGREVAAPEAADGDGGAPGGAAGAPAGKENEGEAGKRAPPHSAGAAAAVKFAVTLEDGRGRPASAVPTWDGKELGDPAPEQLWSKFL